MVVKSFQCGRWRVAAALWPVRPQRWQLFGVQSVASVRSAVSARAAACAASRTRALTVARRSERIQPWPTGQCPQTRCELTRRPRCAPGRSRLSSRRPNKELDRCRAATCDCGASSDTQQTDRRQQKCAKCFVSIDVITLSSARTLVYVFSFVSRGENFQIESRGLIVRSLCVP